MSTEQLNDWSAAFHAAGIVRAHGHHQLAERLLRIAEAIAEAEKQEPMALAKTKERGCSDPRVCTYHQTCMGKCHLPLTNASTAANLRRTDATPPAAQREPLTKDEIGQIWQDIDGSEGMLMRFARAIEAAHGIGGKA